MRKLNVGDKCSVLCQRWDEVENNPCGGYMNGTYGGRFYIGGVRYDQCLNALCNRCGAPLAEAFQVWDEENGEYYETDQISFPINDDGDDITFRGLGQPAAVIDPQFWADLQAGWRTD